MNKYILLLVFLCLNVTAMELRNGKNTGKREATNRDFTDEERATTVPPILITAEMFTREKIRSAVEKHQQEAEEYQAYIKSNECAEALKKYFNPEMLDSNIVLSEKAKK